MTNANASAPARTAKRMLVALASVAAIAASSALVQAQQQPPAGNPQQRPPAPRQVTPQRPAQPQQQAPQQAAPQQQAQGDASQPQLIFSPWVKLCNKDADPKAKRVCVTVKDGRVELGLLVVSVAIIEMDGEQKKLLRMSLPYGVALQHGTRLIVDQQHRRPRRSSLASLRWCRRGRIADYEATVDLIGRMKKAQLLTVQAIDVHGQAMSPQLELEDFAKAYDGPPTDPKVFEEQQKKLQEELQKRAEDARKRLESQQPQALSEPL